jgi:hypothetical protein
MSVSLFSITGFFAVKNGNKQNYQHRTRYDTAISCVHPPAIPAELYAYSPPGQPFLSNGTVVHLTGKVFYPPPGDSGSVIIAALEMSPFPGDPSKRAYHDTLPNFSHPIVTAVSVVSGTGETSDLHALTFPLTVQDYVRGGLKASTITFVQLQLPHKISSLIYPPSIMFQLPCEQSVDKVAERRCAPSPLAVDRDRDMPRNHGERPLGHRRAIAQSAQCPCPSPTRRHCRQ